MSSLQGPQTRALHLQLQGRKMPTRFMVYGENPLQQLPKTLDGVWLLRRAHIPPRAAHLPCDPFPCRQRAQRCFRRPPPSPAPRLSPPLASLLPSFSLFSSEPETFPSPITPGPQIESVLFHVRNPTWFLVLSL